MNDNNEVDVCVPDCSVCNAIVAKTRMRAQRMRQNVRTPHGGSPEVLEELKEKG